jgi:hypothetical protein
MRKRVPEVDALVRDRLKWLDRDIKAEEKQINELERRLGKARAKLQGDMAERARLLTFLPSEFEEKGELIYRFCDLEVGAFRDGMSCAEREALDVERQALVLRMGMPTWPIEEIRKTVAAAERMYGTAQLKEVADAQLKAAADKDTEAEEQFECGICGNTHEKCTCADNGIR